MKTPDTEWEKELREKLKDFGSRCYWYGEETGDYDLSNIEQYEPETLDKIMNLLSSRDTYWKERVASKDDLLDDMWGLICNVNGGIVENEKEEWYQAFLRIREKYFEQFTPITNEDNLK